MWIYDRDTLQIVDVNDAAVRAYGYSRAEFLELTILDIRPPEEIPRLRDALDVPRDGWRKSGVWCHRAKGGSDFYVEITSQDCTIDGRACVVVSATDVTQRVQAEEAAREAEARLNEAQHLARVGSWHWDVDTDVVAWSPELHRIWGMSPDEPVTPYADQREWYLEGGWQRLRAASEHCVATGEPYEIELEAIRRDGAHRWLTCRAAPSRDASGRIVGLIGTVQDVTERMHAFQVIAERESELRGANERRERSERRYRDLLENLNDIVWSTNMHGIITYVSPNAEEYGFRVSELIGQPYADMVFPDDMDNLRAARAAALAGAAARCEYRAFNAAGQIRYVRASFRAIFDESGEPIGFSGVLHDITDQRKAEEQLRAAQRLEAIGRLAGGIAHDFNNLLVVIKGYAELAKERLDDRDPLRDDLEEILKAGDRASALTQHLLAFSRRQVLRPAVVNLNTVVLSLTPMLSRVIGEDIKFETSLQPSLPPVLIDTAQMEHALLNLVVNARDAMPDGGRLTITTRTEQIDDPHPEGLRGTVVSVTVEDTGHGMDDLTRARIFEPFFTTKPTGQGTGLGLPMVYGYVKQSGGAIDVTSAPGEGTRIRLVLPLHVGAEQVRSLEPPPAVRRGSERILVVEDEDSVRQLVERVLSTAGYDSISVSNPLDALALLKSSDCGVQLLLTDVVMPGMTGVELAQQAAVLCPGLRVLYMSGYRNVPPSAQAKMDADAMTIGKPFTSAELTGAVRKVLEK